MARDLSNWRWNERNNIYNSVKNLGQSNPYIKRFPNLFVTKTQMFFGPNAESLEEFRSRVVSEYADSDFPLTDYEVANFNKATNHNEDHLYKQNDMFVEFIKTYPKGTREYNHLNLSLAKIFSPFCNCMRRGMEIDFNKLISLMKDREDRNKPFSETKFYRAIEQLKDITLVADTCAMALWKFKGIDPNGKNVYALIQPVLTACQISRRLTAEEREKWSIMNTQFSNTKSKDFTYNTYQLFLDDCRSLSNPRSATRDGRI